MKGADMKLWLLKRSTEWEYDETNAFVVRAIDAMAARGIAAANSAEEGAETWLNETKSTCVEIEADGEPGVILEDHRAG